MNDILTTTFLHAIPHVPCDMGLGDMLFILRGHKLKKSKVPLLWMMNTVA